MTPRMSLKRAVWLVVWPQIRDGLIGAALVVVLVGACFGFIVGVAWLTGRWWIGCAALMGLLIGGAWLHDTLEAADELRYPDKYREIREGQTHDGPSHDD